MPAGWRLARSLITLRDQVNKQHPRRSKKDDGTIGDAAHASRSSDHNPHIRDGATGVVTALDLTHDPKNGFDAHALAEYMRTKRDVRIKYVISNARIFSSTQTPWTWRRYAGSNAHRAHVHFSVGSSKSQYDDDRVWDIPSAKETPPIAGPEAEIDTEQDTPSKRPVLRKGSSGDYVRIVQRLLMLPPDGQFGDITAAAVRGFQRGNDLTADGIVGVDTWAKLDDLEQEPVDNWFTDIVATEFGGRKDPNRSAYENRMITDTELGVALPFRFDKNERPQVVVESMDTGKSCICSIVDVGPWETSDPYWETKSRPKAESGTDSRGRKTNKAGIDLTPAAAKAIGLRGLGRVRWSFVKTADEGETS